MSDKHYTIEDRMRSEVYLNAIKTCEELEKIQDNKIKKLEKQLEIAIKALKDILNDGDDYWDKDKAQEALTKMEGVK